MSDGCRRVVGMSMAVMAGEGAMAEGIRPMKTGTEGRAA